jgi:hypothetical protein
MKKSASRNQLHLGSKFVKGKKLRREALESSITLKSQRSFAEIENTVRRSSDAFLHLFDQGVQFILRLRGCADGGGEEVLDSTRASVSVAVSFDTKDMAAVVCEAVNQQVSETAPAPLDSRLTPPEAKVQLLHRLLLALPENQLAALRDYYTGVLSVESTCDRHGLSREAFASIRLFLRTRVGLDSEKPSSPLKPS